MEERSSEILALLSDIAIAMKRSKKPLAFTDSVKNLAIAHLDVLGYLMEKKQATMSELAEFARVKMPAMSETVDKLVKTGCVTREHSSQDRRAVIVRIAKKTESMVKKHMEQKRRFFASLMGEFTPGEKEKLIKILKKTKDVITKEML